MLEILPDLLIAFGILALLYGWACLLDACSDWLARRRDRRYDLAYRSTMTRSVDAAQAKTDATSGMEQSFE